jgi:hypothetical protein
VLSNAKVRATFSIMMTSSLSWLYDMELDKQSEVLCCNNQHNNTEE